MDGLTGNTAHQVNWINILMKVMSVESSFTLLYGKIPLKDAFYHRPVLSLLRQKSCCLEEKNLLEEGTIQAHALQWQLFQGDVVMV